MRACPSPPHTPTHAAAAQAAAQLSWYGTTGLKAGAVPAGPSPPNGFTTSIWDMLPSGHGVAETLLGGVQRLYLTQDAGK